MDSKKINSNNNMDPKKPNPFSLHRQRCELIFLIYRLYVLQIENDTQKIWEFFINDEEHFKQTFIKHYRDIFQKISIIEKLIRPFLNKTWRFERLNNLYKAILVVATYEIHFLKLDKKIAIHEANQIASVYAVEKDFQFINAILDQIILK